MSIAYREELVDYQSPLLRMKIWELGYDGTTLPANRFAPRYDWHYHNEAELVLILSGQKDFCIGSKTYELNAGDVAIVGPSELHSAAMFRKTFRQIVCQFDLELYLDFFAAPYIYFFTGMSEPLSRFNQKLREDPDLNGRIADALLRIHEENKAREPGYELAVSMHMKQIMLLLLRCSDISLGNGHELEMLRPILNYVEQNYRGDIDLGTAARQANMSYSYASRLFHQTMGIKFSEYVGRKRIQAAQRLLATSDKNVIVIGAEVGIPNTAHFYRLFRKLNDCSPDQFRRRSKDMKPAIASEND
ncbi:AraC family transcriptional regulator [Paenibacillus sp. LHD-117]|uniref:AraC family transcriptional regulator n=1 Tax=Paenibacillus sp. LHD-117 TaxID=3071412 RepID=UPI0027E07096|nr:AraC family transcriptional regulator [Paenibacillus sp. LHD-117]MDQ6419539.1 AraC family transcriptional regulator [Paenibacillus sp. LHD-117]